MVGWAGELFYVILVTKKRLAIQDLFIVEPLCLYSKLIISSTHNNVN